MCLPLLLQRYRINVRQQVTLCRRREIQIVSSVPPVLLWYIRVTFADGFFAKSRVTFADDLLLGGSSVGPRLLVVVGGVDVSTLFSRALPTHGWGQSLSLTLFSFDLTPYPPSTFISTRKVGKFKHWEFDITLLFLRVLPLEFGVNC